MQTARGCHAHLYVVAHRPTCYQSSVQRKHHPALSSTHRPDMPHGLSPRSMTNATRAIGHAYAIAGARAHGRISGTLKDAIEANAKGAWCASYHVPMADGLTR